MFVAPFGVQYPRKNPLKKTYIFLQQPPICSAEQDIFHERDQDMWIQSRVTLPPKPRGFHLITSEILEQVPEIEDFAIGLMHVFIKHTSASLTVNENADPSVRVDLEMAVNTIAPESLPYIHTMEGPDDMPAHVKSSLLGSSVSIPITDGRPALGVWQGIYLCEHRDRASSRKLVITANGLPY